MLNHRTKLGPRFSEGARLLRERMKVLNITTEDVRRRVQASSGLPSSWLYGDKLPGLIYAQRIEAQFGVPIGAWTSPPSKQFIPPAARKDAA